MTAYYNEIDKHAAAWLRELIKAGHIAAGDVDERDIQDVFPGDLSGYDQCHFFAGIGTWSYSLRKAGWPDHRPVWTGSCPCQPFSSAGKGSAFADERHLWPAFHHLIRQCRPVIVFGEQVASRDADAWIDLVQTDLEAVGYAVGSVPFPSAGVGAPHIRDRIYWVADSMRTGRAKRRSGAGVGQASGGSCAGRMDNATSARHARQECDAERDSRHEARVRVPCAGCEAGRLAVADRPRLVTGSEGRPTARHWQADESDCGAGGVGNSAVQSRERITGSVLGAKAPVDSQGVVDGSLNLGSEHAGSSMGEWPGPTNGFWRDADWLLCRDGKWRPVKPCTFPLVDGAAARVVRLRGYGNSINAIQAQMFIEAFIDSQKVAA
ncbi:MAG: DNA cytosine methyltransferase [Candidatus Accumulibacter sp.]|nr:DNA cytosine methyltransferase [Accumulibacter sp.]